MAGDANRQIELAGVTLPYVRRGSGAPILLLHGGGGPLDALPFFAELSREHDIVAPIHPGFAGTPIPDRFDHVDDLVYLYLDLLDALGLERVALVGFSMGGWVAAEMAIRTTARLRALVLVDAVGIKPGGREDRDVADVFALPAPALTKLMFHDPALAPDLSRDSDAELAIRAANRTALAVYTWEPYMHNPKLPGRLHRIDVPTLLIWGESDGLVSVDYARAYQALIPGAELTTIPRAGHQPQLEQPEVFLDHLSSFLARHGAPTG